MAKVIYGRKYESVMFWLPTELKQALKKEADERGVSIAVILRQMVENRYKERR